MQSHGKYQSNTTKQVITPCLISFSLWQRHLFFLILHYYDIDARCQARDFPVGIPEIQPLYREGYSFKHLRTSWSYEWRTAYGLVGDANLPESERIILQNCPLAKPTDTLVPSGLREGISLIEEDSVQAEHDTAKAALNK